MAMSGKVLAEQLREMAQEAVRTRQPPLSSDFARRLDAEFDRVFPKKPKGDTGNNPQDT